MKIIKLIFFILFLSTNLFCLAPKSAIKDFEKTPEAIYTYGVDYLPKNDISHIEPIFKNIGISLVLVHFNREFDVYKSSIPIIQLFFAFNNKFDRIYQISSGKDYFDLKKFTNKKVHIIQDEDKTYNFKNLIGNTFILCGLYLNECHLDAYTGLLKQFIKAYQQNKELRLNIIIPMYYVFCSNRYGKIYQANSKYYSRYIDKIRALNKTFGVGFEFLENKILIDKSGVSIIKITVATNDSILDDFCLDFLKNKNIKFSA